MSETRRYVLHCDAGNGQVRCTEWVMGKVDETPSRMRRRLTAWTYTRYELTPYEQRAGKAKGRIRNDYCPVHAHLAKETEQP